jgi:ubiquitin carboxyl-terminal hydrolase 1
MNERDAFFAQYETAAFHHHWRDSFPSYSYSFLIATVALFVIFCVFDPSRNPKEHLTGILAFGIRMVSRVSAGILRFQGGSVSGRDGGALKTVFGLDSGSLRNISPAGTALRGLGTLLKGTASDIPPGLGNMSNSCYQNSIIQGLSSLRSLPDFLMRIKAKKPAPNSTNGALLTIMDKLNDPLSNGKHFWLPDKLKSMSTWQQQDAQEYFSKVLEQLDREAVQSLQMVDNGKYGLLPGPPATKLPEASEPSSGTQSLQNPLEGMLAQRVGCTQCGYSEGLSLIPFNCLTVPLGHNYMYDVRDCLDEYTKLEQIEGVECPKCTLQRAEKQLTQISNSEAPEAFLDGVRNRLQAVTESLHDDDFSDNTIIKKCQIPKKHWVSSTKSKQAVIARPPQSLAIHVNRSLFNELTGAQTKNNASVQFPLSFDLSYWCLGNRSRPETGEVFTEDWSMDPRQSMLPGTEDEDELPTTCNYELRAVVTHYGRHENGHYICYRKRLHHKHQGESGDIDEDLSNDVRSESERKQETWWQLSDEDVNIASEDTVLRQGGVFMLFYERVESSSTSQTVEFEDSVSSQSIALPLEETVEASVAAEIPLPDDSSDSDDLLDHFEPASTSEHIIQTRIPTADVTTLLSTESDEESEPTFPAQQTSPPRPPTQQDIPKVFTASDYPTPPLSSADEAERESVDNSDSEEISSASLHDETASHPESRNEAAIETNPTDRVRMRTSGLGSKFKSEDRPLQPMGSRVITAL